MKRLTKIASNIKQNDLKTIVEQSVEKIDWKMAEAYAETDFSIAFEYAVIESSRGDVDEDTISDEDAVEITRDYIRRTEDCEYTQNYIFNIAKVFANKAGYTNEQLNDIDTHNELVDAICVAKTGKDVIEFVCDHVEYDKQLLNDTNNEILKSIKKNEQ